MAQHADDPRSIIATLRARYVGVVRIESLESEWAGVRAAGADGDVAPGDQLRGFLRSIARGIVLAVDLQTLAGIVLKGVDECRDASFRDIDYKALLPDGVDGDDLRTDTLDAPVILKILRRVYDETNRVERAREPVTHYLGVIKHAETYLDAVRKCIREFVLDDAMAGIAGTVAARERLVGTVCVNIDTDAMQIAALRADLIALDEDISKRKAMLERFVSSVRMLNQSTMEEMRANSGQSRFRTERPGRAGRPAAPMGDLG